MAAAENQSAPVSSPTPEKKSFFSKKEKGPAKSPYERYEARKHLLQLLLIVLVGVGIVYFGFNLGIGVLGFALWVLGRITGVA